MQNRLAEYVKGLSALFMFTVVAPTIVAIIYFGFLTSDVYISESKFVVQSPDKPASSGLGVILKGAGFTSAGDEIYAATNYALSRDALTDLNRNGLVSRAYGSQSIFFLNRYNPLGLKRSFESLYRYYKSKVTILQDTTSSITTLTVRAYTAADAHRINEELLVRSEAVVNGLNERGRNDLIGYAKRELDMARAEANRAALALSAFRNQEGVVDPEKQATAALGMISKLQDLLITTRADLLQLTAFTPQNPQIPVLRARAAGIAREINRELGKVAGDQKSLAATAARYQRLQLDTEFADKQLGVAMASYQEAQNEARRKQAYVERIVQPNLPDTPIEPQRLRAILSTFALGLVAWGILRMLFAGVKEHGE